MGLRTVILSRGHALPGRNPRLPANSHTRSISPPRHLVVLLLLLSLGLHGCQSSPAGPSTTKTTIEVIPTPGSDEDNLPAAPELVQPRTAWIHGSPMEVTWKPVKRASSYRVVVSRDKDLGNPIAEWSVPATAHSPDALVRRPVDLETQAGETLHVGILAVTATGALSATTRASVPVRFAIPQVIDPPAGATVKLAHPRFEWTAVAGATAYEFEVLGGTSVGIGTTLAAHPLLRVTISGDTPVFEIRRPLPRTGALRIRVRPLGNTRPGEWSKERAFLYEPLRPRITNPVQDEHVISRHPLIEWEVPVSPGPSAEAAPNKTAENDTNNNTSDPEVRYEIEICVQDSRGECEARYLGESSVPVYRPAVALRRGQSHRVRVRVKSDVLWSDPVVFIVRKDRPHPLPISELLPRFTQHAWRSAMAPDGQFLAVTTRRVPALGEDSETNTWDLQVFERDQTVSAPSFTEIRGAGTALPGGDIIHADLAWSPDRDAIDGLYASISGNGVQLLRHWSTLSRLPFSIPGNVTAISAARTLDDRSGGPPSGNRRRERLFLEVSRNDTRAQPLPLLDFDVTRMPRRGNSEIWSVSPDGSDLRLLTMGRDPAPSPDGRTLAYSIRIDDAERKTSVVEIRMLVLDDAETVTRVPATGPLRDIRGLAWSPDGRYLAYARDVGLGFDIAVLHLDSSTETAVTGTFAPELFPVFVPSSRLDRAFDGLAFTTTTEETTHRIWSLGFVEFTGDQ